MRRPTASKTLLAVGLALTALAAGPSPAGADCTPVVTGTHGGLNGTSPAMAYDGTLATGFRSSYNDWQYVQIDLGCPRVIGAVTRYMSRGGSNTSGARTLQGESASYSLDGVNWTQLTASTSHGWERYVNYRPHAWHSVNYGWSVWLHLNQPATARYVRFQWDGDSDALHEVKIHVPVCVPVVSGDRTGLAGTRHALAADGRQATYFKSSYNDWQYVQIDFGCVRRIASLSRYMSRDGSNTSGRRVLQGESVSYSLDGVNWTQLTSSTSHGWEGYVNYRPHAWHSVNHGWSAALRLNQPADARYVRFHWDGDNDALHEIWVDSAP